MRRPLFFFSFLIFSTLAGAQPAIQWQTVIGGNMDDEVYEIRQTSDGGYVAVGASYSNTGLFSGNHGQTDIFVVKLTPGGDLEWLNTYGGSSSDWGVSIRQTHDGGYIVAGSTSSDDGDVSGFHGGLWGDAWVIKLDATGQMQWQKCLGGQESEYAAAIRQTPDHGYIVAGATSSNDGDVNCNNESYSIWIVKLDQTGEIEWQSCFSESSQGGADDIQLTSDGGYIVAGWRMGDQPNGDPNEDIWVIKLDETGTQQWESILGGSKIDLVHNIQETLDGGYILAGLTQSDDGDVTGFHGHLDAWVVKLDETGAVQWEKALGGSSADQASAIRQTADGGYLLAGYTASNDGDLAGWPDVNGFWLVKLDETAEIEWQWGHEARPFPTEISMDIGQDGRIILAGICMECSGDNSGRMQMWAAKLFFPNSAITGRVHLDPEGDCQPDDAETGLSGWLITASGLHTFYALTDSAGRYSIPVDTGSYVLTASPPSPYHEVCEEFMPVTLESNDTIPIDFPSQALADCPYLTVDIATPLLRRCFENIYTVQYCNYGAVIAEDAYIEVSLDPHMQYLSSTLPLSGQNGNLLRFDLGDVDINECGNFQIAIHLDCDSTVLGQTHCVEAHIFPDSLCIPPSAEWDGSTIEVDAACQGDSVVFLLHNTGSGAMSQQRQYIIIEDDIVLMQGNFQLDAGQSETIAVDAAGATFHAEAQQSPGHPAGIASTGATIEGCNGWMTLGLFNQWPQNSPNPFVDTDCRQNVGSFDPNDKNPFPFGFGPQRLIEPGQDIEYMIRFQNTGTDTAFRVVIVDVLPPELDLATLRPGASSHAYAYSVTPDGKPLFSFNNILLPDSATNEAASQGFVNFRISQQPGLPPGTEIANSALIYFDFNEPIETNTTLHRIGVVFPWLPPGTVGTRSVLPPSVRVRVIPNPVDDTALLQVEGIAPGRLRLALSNALGQVLHTQENNGTAFEFRRGALPAGLYFFRIEREGRVVGTGKMVLR